MLEHDLVWAILPNGLEQYFDVEKFEKGEEKFRITLIEKNTLPETLPEEYRGKRVINTVLNDMELVDFPIRGRKCEIVLRRRWWKFEGVDRMLMRDLDAQYKGLRIEKEFGAFLKELDREQSGGN